MVSVIVQLSRFLLLILMLLYSKQCFTVFGKKDEMIKRRLLRKQLFIIILLDITAFGVMYLQTRNIGMLYGLAAAVIYTLALRALYRIFYKKASALLINNMALLLNIGFIIIARLDFASAAKQYMIAVAGTLISLVVPVTIRKAKGLKNLKWIYAVMGLGMLGAVLVLSVATRGANLSIEIGGITFQFSEVVKLTFVFFVASILQNDTSFKNVVKATAVAAVHVLILVMSKDLGTALVFFVAYLVMVYAATKKLRYAAIGLAGGSAAAVGAYYLFNHVRQRVLIWKDPFAVYDEIGGAYQIAQSLFAIGAGGWFGRGLFEGTPQTIPIVKKDFIFAAITEELGAFFAICMLLVCMSCFLMIVNISMGMSKPFYRLVALGLGTEYAFQVFLTVGGQIKFIPLTGITLPLVSYGGSSVIATILMFAIVQGLYILREDEGEKRDETKKQKKHTKNRNEKSFEEKLTEETQRSLNW